jgi:hypothetical protein
MKIAKYMLAAAAACMSVTPALAASANPAASLSVVQSTRAGSATDGDSKALGGGLLIGVLAFAAAFVAIVLIVDDEDSDNGGAPDSP